MTMVKTMIRSKKKSSVSLAITTSGLNPPVLTILFEESCKERAKWGLAFDPRLSGEAELNPLIHLGECQWLNQVSVGAETLGFKGVGEGAVA